MLELNVDNVLDYVRERGWLESWPARVEPLGGGVSNVVLRLETPQQVMVLKQSRPQLRTRDAWFSNLDRVFREQEVMQMLHPLLPVGTVPEVLFSDRDNFVFVMSHAPPGARPWKQLLLAGQLDLALGEHVGRVLGRMHEATASNPNFREPFADHTVFVQLRVEPFYYRVQERCPEVKDAIGRIAAQMLACKEALCHGDYTPKNMLVHDEGFTLVDYETACCGDPTMDLGLCLCHLLLKGVCRQEQRQDFWHLTRAFWKGYAAEVRFQPIAELQSRAIGHCGVCLLARIDGTSPVDYLPEESKRETVRRLGRVLLLDNPTTWDDVLHICDREMG